MKQGDMSVGGGEELKEKERGREIYAVVIKKP
jgi:hypothetical protein